MEESFAKPESSYIPTLDGWRAIAVTLVIGAHAARMLLANGSWPARQVAALFNHAGYGVDIFFALSGFLICTLLLREKERTQTISLSRFYVRRAFRILPPMILYLACISFLSFIHLLPHISIREIVSVLFFYRNYAQGTWYTGHFWSLAVEEHFYAFAPLFILLLDKKWAVRVSLALIVACISIRAIEFSQGTLIQFRTENRFDGLLWGCILAFALRPGRIRISLQENIKQWHFGMALVTSVVLLTILPSQPERRTVVGIAMPILIACTVLQPQSLVGKVLEWSLLKWIGRISYSLYLWQMMFLPERERTLGAFHEFPLNLIAPVICASLSFYLLEKPMMQIGHRLAAAPGAEASKRFS